MNRCVRLNENAFAHVFVKTEQFMLKQMVAKSGKIENKYTEWSQTDKGHKHNYNIKGKQLK